MTSNGARPCSPARRPGTNTWHCRPSAVSGDGLRLGESVGARVNTSQASPVAWAPVSRVPYRDGSSGHFPHIIERGKPGIIGVLSNGQRFVNEANGYYDYVTAMVACAPPGEEVASWLICSHGFQRRYGLGISRPFPVPLSSFIRSGYLKTGKTLEELARACGIDPIGLRTTVADYNRHARNGQDPQFGRGSTPYNRKQGDALHQPNPCVAPIEQGPFYAVKVEPGCFGTFAGLKVNQHAQVLDDSGQAISGLYAAGGDMASIMGGHYPAGGINLGPALTFGYIAARHIAGITAYEKEIDHASTSLMRPWQSVWTLRRVGRVRSINAKEPLSMCEIVTTTWPYQTLHISPTRLGQCGYS